MVDQVRLPVDVEEGARGGPRFKTTVLEAVSGHEQRQLLWDECRGEWDIGYGIRSPEDLMAVIKIFRAARGKGFAFLFKDWVDYQLEDELIGTGDGSEDTFQIIKTYSTFDDTPTLVRSYVRNITQPRESTLVVEVNNTPLLSSDWALSAGGILVLDTPPGNTHTVKVTGEFDVPVRFDIDYLPVTAQHEFVGSIRDIRIVEVLDE
jgi:uncharacterized protein (TIGR02217 family)